MAVNTQKLLPSTKGSAIVKAKTTNISADKISVSSKKGKTFEIKTKVIEIDKILKGTFTAKKKQEDKEKQEEQKEKRAGREKDLEKKPDKEKKSGPKLKVPAPSFFDKIKNFILNTLLGYGVVRLLDYLPQLKQFAEGLKSVLVFVEDVGGTILNGLITLVDWGYRLYDGFRGFVGDTFGEEGLKKFDELSKNLNTFINAALLAGLAFLKFGFLRKGLRGLVGTFRTVFRRGLIRAVKRVSLKLFGKGATQLVGKGLSAAGGAIGKVASSAGSKLAATKVGGFVAKIFGKSAGVVAPIFKTVAPKVSGFAKRIPILGPIIAGVFSLLAGEPPGQAIFKALGAALGGALGSFIPIPVVGTLIGETIGIFIGDLLYELILGNGPEAAFKKLKDGFGAIFRAGEAVGKFLGDGFGRFFPKFFEKHPIEIKEGGGRRSLATKVAKLFGIYDFLKNVGYAGGKDGQVDKFPNLLQLFNPLSMIPLMMDSFFPPSDNPPTPNFGSFFGSGTPETSDTTTQGESGYSGPGLGSGGDKRMGEYNIGGSGDIVKIGKDLISKGFSVAEHPDFTKTPTASGGAYTPGEGTVSPVHSGRGHYEGRAIDVTDWRGTLEDSKARYRSVLDSLYNDGNMAQDMLLIHDSWGIADSGGKNGPGSHAHPTHMHIEVRDKGGKIGKGIFANLGGPEFILDADTTKALEDNVPGFLSALNKADYNSAMAVLRNYASYEGNQMQIIPVPVPVRGPSGTQSQGGSSVGAGSKVASKQSDWKESLYMGG